jgi:hypothetical protein
MKLRATKILFTVFILGLFYFSLSSNSGGVPGGGTSGCNCHGSANGGTILTLSGLPSGGYVAGTSYVCTLSVYSSGFVSAGFALGCDLGTLSSVGSGITLASSNQEIYHSSPKTLTASNADFIFTWTAPAAGTVTFSYAGNAVNGNGATSLDMWNKTTSTLLPVGGASLPSVVLSPIVNTTSTTAQISVMTNANGNATSTVCKYGTTSALGQSQNATPFTVNGNTAVAQTCSLVNLVPNTKYYYRITTTNVAGSVSTIDTSFTTKFATSIENNSLSGYNLSQMGNQLLIQNVTTPCKVFLYNANGILVKQEKLNAMISQSIDIQFLPQGFYIFKILTENNEVRTLPFIFR